MFLVQAGIAHGGRCGCRTARIAQFLSGQHVFVNLVLHKEPGALVLRLVLAPHHFLRVGVASELGCKCLVREGVRLLNADQRHIMRTQLLTLACQVVVDLA